LKLKKNSPTLVPAAHWSTVARASVAVRFILHQNSKQHQRKDLSALPIVETRTRSHHSSTDCREAHFSSKATRAQPAPFPPSLANEFLKEAALKAVFNMISLIWNPVSDLLAKVWGHISHRNTRKKSKK
jgi:hypothetical protein